MNAVTITAEPNWCIEGDGPHLVTLRIATTVNYRRADYQTLIRNVTVDRAQEIVASITAALEALKGPPPKEEEADGPDPSSS